jgi:hypothetical protein
MKAEFGSSQALPCEGSLYLYHKHIAANFLTQQRALKRETLKYLYIERFLIKLHFLITRSKNNTRIYFLVMQVIVNLTTICDIISILICCGTTL